MRAILAATIFCLSLCAFVGPAEARHHTHNFHGQRSWDGFWFHDGGWKSARHHGHISVHHRHARRQRSQVAHEYHGGGIVTVPTAAHISITVKADLVPRFQALIADFVAAGYRPRHIGCFAHGGHVPNSRHYAGAACDFDQSGWGKTVAFMYGAHAIIAKHGLRDGCSFRDCGHVDDGVHIARRTYARYARRYRYSRFGG